MRHTLSVLVENKFGVLARVSGMFSGRGFNIDSLNVAPTHDPALSRITAVLNGDDTALDMVTKQLRKLINVVEVVDFHAGEAVQRELLLTRVKATSKTRSEIMQICDIFRAKIVNVAQDAVIIEITGDEASLDLCVKQLRKLVNVVEVVDFHAGEAVQRELLLTRVKATSKTRSEIMQICDIFRAKIVNVAQDAVIIEITGDEGKLTPFLKLLEPFGILEIARTGLLALKRDNASA